VDPAQMKKMRSLENREPIPSETEMALADEFREPGEPAAPS
jgi:hypothetical protein